ncbi:putative glycosyl transferase, family 14 [Helianthus debilis subsp. tardiflorus]
MSHSSCMLIQKGIQIMHILRRLRFMELYMCCRCVLDKSFMRRWHLKDRTPCDNKGALGMDGRNCYVDEHYLPTFFYMLDPYGIANWSVTHVDWSEGKWHPKSYHEQDFSYQLIKNITKKTMVMPCMWNGINRPCYLFARKFKPDTLHRMIDLFTNQTMF